MSFSFPGSINLPVLNLDQRKSVGTKYHEDSFMARKIGAGMVAENIAKHMANYFIDKPQTYVPLVYCWRGGQRSRSLALVLEQTGFKPVLLTGGYKTYRKKVVKDLKEMPSKFRFIVLSGKF